MGVPISPQRWEGFRCGLCKLTLATGWLLWHVYCFSLPVISVASSSSFIIMLCPRLLLLLLLLTASVTSRGLQGHHRVTQPSSRVVDVADPCKAGELELDTSLYLSAQLRLYASPRSQCYHYYDNSWPHIIQGHTVCNCTALPLYEGYTLLVWTNVTVELDYQSQLVDLWILQKWHITAFCRKLYR